MKHCLVALVWLLLVAQSTAQEAPYAEKVDAIAARHLKTARAVGLSIGVLWNGQLLGKGYGLADAEHDVPANGATMFRIGSITKQFTAAMVMRLVEQGKLVLDEPAGKHLPQFPTGEHKVTLHQLLNHTSGIKSYTDIGEEWQKVWPIELTHEQLLGLVKDKPFDFAPGQDWHYNNTGYYLLGMLLENVNGRSYAAQVAELAGELGLLRTRYDSNRDLIKNRARGYEFEDFKLRNATLLGMNQPGAAGGILSTGADLVRWAKALAAGKVVSAASYRKMCQAEVLPSGRDTRYGYGLMVRTIGDKPCIGHGGGIHGFNSDLFWLAELDFHVAVISNGGVRADRVAADIAYELLGLERPKPADLPTPEELRAKLIGDYHIDTLDMAIKVFERDGRLLAQGGGQEEFGLLYQGRGEFWAVSDHAVRLMFARDGSSFELHQAGAVMRAVKK